MDDDVERSGVGDDHEGGPVRAARILYVDDEEEILFLAKRMLERLGHRVETFTRGGEALSAFAAAPSMFDLAILDFAMPHLSGLDLARQIREIRDDFPIIVVSGGYRAQERRAAESLGLRHFLDKPPTMETLKRSVEEALQLKTNALLGTP